MTTTPPTLRVWHGLKPPEIRTLGSLGGAIPPLTYSDVYWIAKTALNAVVEYYPLTDWYFTEDGQLIGDVFTPQKQTVEIKLDDYVILGVR